MHKKIESRESFFYEYESMLEKYDEKISELEQYFKVRMDDVSSELAEEFNRLKRHRFRLKETLEANRGMSEETWKTIRDEIREQFRAAEKEFKKISEVMSDQKR